MECPSSVLETVSSQEAFRDLREDWNRLLSDSPRKSFFLTWEWQYSWWENYQRAEGPRQLHLVVSRDGGGRPNAILPLYRQRVWSPPVGRLQLLRLLGFPHESSEYLDLVCGNDLDAGDLEGLYDGLLASGADGLVLTDLLPDSLLLCSVSLWARKRGLSQVRRARHLCPYLPFQRSFEEYLGSRSKCTRTTLKRRVKALEKVGKVVLRRVEEVEEARGAVRSLFRLHRKRWKVRGRSGFDLEPRQRFHEVLAARALEAGHLRLYFLEVDGRQVAAAYCFRYGEKVYYYQAGMDPAFARQSAGMVLLLKAVEDSIAEGGAEFDLLRGPEAYKFHWADRTRETCQLSVAFTRRARLALAASTQWNRGKGAFKGSLSKILNFRSSLRAATPSI